MTIPKQCYSCGGACGGGHDGKPCRYVAIPELPEPAYHRAHQPNHSSDFRRGDWTGDDDRKWSRGGKGTGRHIACFILDHKELAND